MEAEAASEFFTRIIAIGWVTRDGTGHASLTHAARVGSPRTLCGRRIPRRGKLDRSPIRKGRRAGVGIECDRCRRELPGDDS